MTGCWAIWEKRNKVLFDQGEWRAEDVIRRTKELIWEMEGVLRGEDEVRRMAGNGAMSAGDGRQHSESVGGVIDVRGWARPREGVVKINLDAGVMEGVGTGLGLICRNASGSIEWCVTIQKEVEMVPELAEAWAVLEGLKEARRSGYTKVEVESDCRGVVADLKARRSGRSELALIYADIFSLCNLFDVFSFSFVSRNYNTVAQGLAHAVPWTVGRRSWVSDFPNWILCKVNGDLINMN
ncbi:uncharacterized protein LOC141595440 [Silene latifolia]|uniref:uncharacterized protein LOC141595440 n=1 Tax=Silene latifolia TaxID=37657 RepID=UPI003D76B986